MRFWRLAIAALGLATAAPASACEMGPFWVTFAHGSSSFAGDSEGFVSFSAELYRQSPNNHVQISFYNPGAGSAKLWQSRIAAVRRLLRREGVPAHMIHVVQVKTANGMLGKEWIGRAPRLEINVTSGCG